jgi:hypothetical protein
MRSSPSCWPVVVIASAVLASAQSVPPLIDLPLAGDLENRGTLAGAAALAEYAAEEGPVYDVSPFGVCIDLTRAARHGGVFGKDVSPAGGALVFPGERLVNLECFTVVVWARQNPDAEGVSARLAMTETGWDLLPTSRGVALSFLHEAEKKTTATLNAAPFERGRVPLPTDWRFTALAIDREVVRGCLGGVTQGVVPLREAPRPGPLGAAWGNLVIGNLMGIRPFNGWLARFRIYDRALSLEEMGAIAAADRADAARAGMAALQTRPNPERPLLFKRSAIPFSTRWQRPQALEVMDSFHATDCLWVYGNKQEYAAAIQATGRRYQGTLNGLQGTARASPGKAAAGDPSGRHEDLDGNKNMPTWMVTFKPPHYTGCCNHPAFRAIFFADAKAYVDMGVDMIHVDDSAMNASWVSYAGVCFCEHCRSGFRDYLRRTRTPDALRALGVADIAAFDYREHLKAKGIADAAAYRKEFKSLPLTPDFVAFQIEGARAFYREFRARLDEWSPGRHIAISVNEGIPLPAADTHGRLVHADLVDFYHGEAYYRTVAANLTGNKTAEALGLQLVSTPVLQGVADGARTLALAYALGQFQLVPWDVYMGSDETGSVPRYNGTREDFGAYYDLIHAQPQLFDTARPLAALGVLVNADLEETPRVTRFCERLAARQVPFHLVVTATRQARIPLRENDLRSIRALIALSPVDSLHTDDRGCLDRVLAERRLRLLAPDADLEGFLAARGLDTLRLEGPPGIYLFPRQTDDGTTVIHVVNWNTEPATDRPEAYTFVTVALRRWGPVARVTYWQPGEQPLDLDPEVHANHLRITLPRLETWGILALAPPGM